MIPSTVHLQKLVSVSEDRLGRIWAGGNSGLWHVEGDAAIEHLRGDGQRFPSVTAVCPSRNGGVWVGAIDGLYLVSPAPVRTIGKEAGLPNEDVWTVSEAREGNLWVGTSEGVCKLSNHETKVFQYVDGVHANTIRTIREDSGGKVWVGAIETPERNGGLGVIRDGILQPMGNCPIREVTSIDLAPDGAVLVSGGMGRENSPMILSIFKNGHVENLSSPGGILFCSSNGRIHLSWDEDWTYETAQFRKATLLPEGLSGPHAIFHEDESGALWLCSQYNGIIRHKSGVSRAITTTNGLPSNLVLAMLEDDFGRYWFGTHNGIFWARKTELNAVADGLRATVTCVRYGAEDGMASEEGNGGNSPNACRGSNGRLYFATTKGLVEVTTPETLFDDDGASINFEEFEADGQILFRHGPDFTKATKVQPRETKAIESPIAAGMRSERPSVVVKPGGGDSVLVRFSSSDLSFPERTRFRFRLKESGGGWSELGGQQFVRLVKLAPGAHTLQVRAGNAHGVWGGPIGEFKFKITPFFYQTAAFYSAVCTTLLLSGWFIYSYRKRVARRIAALETEATLSRERERIARDIHDDLGANLTRIALLSETVRTDSQTLNPETLGRISHLSRAAVDSISEMVWATNPKFDDLASLSAYFRSYAAQFFEPLKIQLTFEASTLDSSIKIGAELRRELFLVFKETLNNIAKHAKATKVCICLSIETDSYNQKKDPEKKAAVLEIHDNGIGLPAEAKSSTASSFRGGNGIKNMTSRAVRWRGTFEFSSRPGLGTSVKLRVPLD